MAEPPEPPVGTRARELCYSYSSTVVVVEDDVSPSLWTKRRGRQAGIPTSVDLVRVTVSFFRPLVISWVYYVVSALGVQSRPHRQYQYVSMYVYDHV